MTPMAAVVGLIGLLGQLGVEASPAGVTREQAEALAVRLGERRPFLESQEARKERATLGQFFKDPDYRVLRGNPLLGYWDRGGFAWSGDRVAWEGIESAAGCRRVQRTAWDRAFAYAVKKAGLVVDPAAPIRVRGACVWAVVEASADEPVPGVLLEIKVAGGKGLLRYRFGMGKATVEDAIGAAVELVVAFAKGMP
jgi:hypothetical protein